MACLPFDEDSELAERARQGDRTAFGALIEKYQGPIYAYALHFFRDPTRAEDLVQEAFLRAYRFLHTYDSRRRFTTWLYTIARNLCIDSHREDVRRGELLAAQARGEGCAAGHPERDPAEVLEHRESEELLREAVASLPEKYRTPIILCYLQDLSYQEISEVLGISLNNTKIRIFRAKKMILSALGADGGKGP